MGKAQESDADSRWSKMARSRAVLFLAGFFHLFSLSLFDEMLICFSLILVIWTTCLISLSGILSFLSLRVLV